MVSISFIHSRIHSFIPSTNKFSAPSLYQVSFRDWEIISEEGVKNSCHPKAYILEGGADNDKWKHKIISNGGIVNEDPSNGFSFHLEENPMTLPSYVNWHPPHPPCLCNSSLCFGLWAPPSWSQHSSNRPGMLLPLGLGTGYSLCLDALPQDFPLAAPHLFQVRLNVTSSIWPSLTTLSIRQQVPFLPPNLPDPLPCFVLPHHS